MKLQTHPAGLSRPHAFLPLIFFLAAAAAHATPGAEPTGDTNLAPTVVARAVPPPRFESWPLPPPRPSIATNAPAAPGAEAAEKAALAKAAGAKRRFEFHADNL